MHPYSGGAFSDCHIHSEQPRQTGKALRTLNLPHCQPSLQTSHPEQLATWFTQNSIPTLASLSPLVSKHLTSLTLEKIWETWQLSLVQLVPTSFMLISACLQRTCIVHKPFSVWMCVCMRSCACMHAFWCKHLFECLTNVNLIHLCNEQLYTLVIHFKYF